MRLIDADAMTPETIIEIKRVFGRGGRLRTARTSVEVIRYSRLLDAPTLDYELVKRGKWEWYEEPYDSRNPDGNYGWRCSCCKQDLAAELTLGIPEMHYAYDVLDDPDNPPTIKRCLFCGARMDAKEDER